MITRYAELNQYRVRGSTYTFSTTGPFTWDVQQMGSLLKIDATGTSDTLSFGLTLPSDPNPPTGTRIWIEFHQGGGGGNWIIWPAAFKFQTVGDEIPNATVGKITIWTGIYGVASTDCYMTKLGEW